MTAKKKLLVLVVALVMVFAMSAVALAADSGSITITPPAGIDQDGTITYTIYKVFDAATSEDGTKISYKLVSGKTEAPAGFTVDAAGNVSYAGSEGATELTQDDIDAIAAYVADDDPVAVATSVGGADAVAEGLPNGYYYITTTTGTVVTIDSAKPDAEVIDKNTVPTIDKVITDASSYDADGKKALAQVGTNVEYTSSITVGKGRTGYVFKDTLGAGLEYVEDSLAVEGMTEGTDYTLTVEGRKITVAFKDSSIAKLADDAKIIITYEAKVTSDALQDNPAENTASISYGNNSQYTSDPAKADVYNARIGVVKQDDQEKGLEGAGFVLKNTAGKYYKLAADGKSISWVDSIADATEYTSDANGAVTAFTGLADGTYTLVENTVPSGYNKAADTDVTIAKGDYTAGNLKQTATVVNEPGNPLPSTGGIGTTIFMVLGGILMAAAVVLFITRKRVGIEK